MVIYEYDFVKKVVDFMNKPSINAKSHSVP